MAKKRRKKRTTIKEFSKIYIVVLVSVCLVYLGFCIFLDRQEIGTTITTSILGVSLGYFLKAYMGKKNEEANSLEEMKWQSDHLYEDEGGEN